MDRTLLTALNAERSARRAAVVVTEIVSGAQRLVREDEAVGDPLAEAIERAIRSASRVWSRPATGKPSSTPICRRRD